MTKAVGTVHCSECGAGSGQEKGWCDHLTQYVRENKDAWELDFGIIFDVPIQPTSGLFAKVQISSEHIANVCAPMTLQVEDPIVTGATKEYPLGLWNVGEGLWSIRAVVLDWIKATCKIDSWTQVAACPSSAHTFKHSRQMQRLTPEMTVMHNWFVAAYGLCIPQWRELQGFSSGNFVPQADDKQDSATMQQLRERHGNN